MIMASRALLEQIKNPSKEDIRGALSGNLCRCTGYIKMIESVKYAAKLKKRGTPIPRTAPKRAKKAAGAEYAGERW